MTDEEFDVLDELYFIISFTDLSTKCTLSVDQLKNTLNSLIQKGWVKCFKNKDEELHDSEVDFENSYQHYNFLATKSGLFAHNSRS